MELFRKFSTRGAQLVSAVLRSIDSNVQAKQITLSFRDTENDRAEMRLILTADEAREMRVALDKALVGMGERFTPTSTRLVVEHALWACKKPWFLGASRMGGDTYCIKASLDQSPFGQHFYSLESLQRYVGEQYPAAGE